MLVLGKEDAVVSERQVQPKQYAQMNQENGQEPEDESSMFIMPSADQEVGKRMV